MGAQTGPIRIGVFVPTECQLLDLACVDIFAMMSKQYLALVPLFPKATVDAAPSVEFFYITSPKNMPFIPLTSGMTVRATHDIAHPDVQPGKIDIIMVPGPDPAAPIPAEALEFLRRHAENKGTDILSICTGIFVCGAAGLLGGKTASGPRGLQDDLLKKYPTAKLVGEKYRWIQDGNLWTSGGVTNGNDLVAAYARHSDRFPTAVADMVCMMADAGDRPQLFDQSQVRFTMGFVWTMLRAWFYPKRE